MKHVFVIKTVDIPDRQQWLHNLEGIWTRSPYLAFRFSNYIEAETAINTGVAATNDMLQIEKYYTQ